MSTTIEIIGTYEGERYRFDNGNTSVVIGSLRLLNGSKEAAKKAGITDPHGQISIKGEADRTELEHRRAYRFLGHFQDYFNKRNGTREKQFWFRTFVPHVPHDEVGLVGYLVAAGRGNGIGPAKARRLVQHFGTDATLEGCRTRPEEVAKAASIEFSFAQSFAKVLQNQQATENATLEVDRLLSGRGFPKTLGRRVIKEWGNIAAEMIARDPYRLMQFRGVGFRLTDKLYIELGKDPLSIDRQALCLWYGIASNTEGHTWFAAKQAVKWLQKSIGATGVDYRAAIIRAKEYGQLSDDHYGAIASIRTDGDEGPFAIDGKSLWLAEGKNAAIENSLAEYVITTIAETEKATYTKYVNETHQEEVVLDYARCTRCHRQLTAESVHVLAGKPYGPTCIEYVDQAGSHEVCSLDAWLTANPEIRTWKEEVPHGWFETPSFSMWPDIATIENIDCHQREQLDRALTKRVAILGGSPGTGKTWCVAQLIKALLASGRVGIDDIGIGAPTGKAAVRLSEVMMAAGLDLRARTWHSFLGVGEQSESGGWTFLHGPGCPMPYKVLIGDESSMCDLSLMKSIFAARQPGCHVLLVGDTNQLPPVGGGAPLRDLIASDQCGYGELTEIKRNSGGIVEACAAIRDGKPWSQFTKATGTNLIHMESQNPMESLTNQIVGISMGNVDPVWDCQVVVAVNERSELSRKRVNEFMQNKLNCSPKVEGTRFRERDKIVCLKNGFYESVLGVDESDEDINTNERGEVFCANGELGSVQKIETKYMLVKLDSPRRLVKVLLGKSSESDGESEVSGSGCQWDLGYALSVHKSQGSQWPIVLIVLDDYPGARMVCDRSWLYTAISRAQKQCFLVGDLRLAERFCRVQKIDQRKTFLKELIRQKAFDREAAEL